MPPSWSCLHRSISPPSASCGRVIRACRGAGRGSICLQLGAQSPPGSQHHVHLQPARMSPGDTSQRAVAVLRVSSLRTAMREELRLLTGAACPHSWRCQWVSGWRGLMFAGRAASIARLVTAGQRVLGLSCHLSVLQALSMCLGTMASPWLMGNVGGDSFVTSL